MDCLKSEVEKWLHTVVMTQRSILSFLEILLHQAVTVQGQEALLTVSTGSVGVSPSTEPIANSPHLQVIDNGGDSLSNHDNNRYRMAGNFGGEFILAGNLFWRIGSFESNPPIFPSAKRFAVCRYT